MGRSHSTKEYKVHVEQWGLKFKSLFCTRSSLYNKAALYVEILPGQRFPGPDMLIFWVSISNTLWSIAISESVASPHASTPLLSPGCWAALVEHVVQWLQPRSRAGRHLQLFFTASLNYNSWIHMFSPVPREREIFVKLRNGGLA